MIKKINYNHIIIATFIIASLLFYMFTSFGIFISLGLGYFIGIFLRMINEMGKGIPMKELMSILLLIQVFVSPLFTYRYFENDAHFIMYVPESVYMSYALPAALFFTFGLFIPLSTKKIGASFFDNLHITNQTIIKISLLFILIGIFASYLKSFVPPSLAFILYLLKLLKFIGSFLLLFSNYRYRYYFIGIVYVLFAYEIINGGVFYDLFVWGFFLYILIEIKLKSLFSRKITVIFIGFLLIYFIQSIKGQYRDLAWGKDTELSKTEIFLDVIKNKGPSSDYLKDVTDFDKFISRLNNGWILSKVMEHTPMKQSFTKGETLKDDLISVLLPRILFPNKAKTGGKENQRKFKKFTGRRLIGSTTMRIGALSDAYINFGILGGIITMFFLGLLFNLILYFIMKLSLKNAIFILWIPFIFSYGIRMSDIQVILNYTFKAIIFVLIINFIFFKKDKNYSPKL